MHGLSGFPRLALVLLISSIWNLQPAVALVVLSQSTNPLPPELLLSAQTDNQLVPTACNSQRLDTNREDANLCRWQETPDSLSADASLVDALTSYGSKGERIEEASSRAAATGGGGSGTPEEDGRENFGSAAGRKYSSLPSSRQPQSGPTRVPPRLRMCLVTCELVGPVSNGGIGTAFTALAHSLAGAGHEVTVLFTLGAVSQRGPFQDWVEHYRVHGIALEALVSPAMRGVPRHMRESYDVLQYLKRQDFDMVHFHDYQGAGYYSIMARRQALALVNTTLVVGVHGPSLWAKAAGNLEPIDSIGDLEVDFMERKSVALADYVISPSHFILEWMESEGWTMNDRTYVQPNILPTSDRRVNGASLEARPRQRVTELVFFARLETRKGIITFCDAIDRLLELVRAEGTAKVVGPSSLQRVTFLGRSAMVEGRLGVQYVQERAQKWDIPWKVITRMESAEAKAYLLQGGRLAVMPSRVENSPYTVYECAELGIPFLAANVGGSPDLIHPEDRQQALFEPTAEVLLERLVEALTHGAAAARPRVASVANEEAWLTWHALAADEARREDARRADDLALRLSDGRRPFVTVIITHYNRPVLCRQALESIEAQDYPAADFEVILIDDGSTDQAALEFMDSIEDSFRKRGWSILREKNQYLGAARNTAARHARGKYMLFMDDDNYAKPSEISTYVRAMEAGGADVMTSFVDFFWSLDAPPPRPEARPSYLFLGGSADVGAFKNCFGDANCFVRRSSFEAIGGYTEDYGVGFEDWEMYANASLRGFQVDILPESVYNYRFTRGSMQKTTNYFQNRRRSLRPYLNSLPPAHHDVILSAVFPMGKDGSFAPPKGLAAQGDSKFHGVATPDGEAPPPLSDQAR